MEFVHSKKILRQLQDQFSASIEWLAGLFKRSDTAATSCQYVCGLISNVDRKNTLFVSSAVKTIARAILSRR